MRIHPTRILSSLSLLFLFIIILACSKDSDLILDAIYESDPVLEETVTETQESTETTNEEAAESATEETSSEETSSEDTEPESDIPEGYESRVTSFPPAHDAHIQSGQGYNQQIIRLDEGNRISYLLFDLQPVSEIGAEIVSAELQFTTQGDEGNGTIDIYAGNSANWTETNLDEGSAPDPETLLGSIVKEYLNGVTEKVALNAELIAPAATTLIMDHKDGNDLAAASKEHPSTEGPRLVVTYYAPIDAAEIDPYANQPQEDEAPPANEAPVAMADATPLSGNAPLEVSFSGDGSSDDNGISDYSWDFGDGGSSSAVNPSHTFTELGEYTVSLTVTDEAGLTDSDTVTITVTNETDQPPVARISANTTSGPAPLEVAFTGDNSSDDDAIVSYQWNFKDGSSSTEPNPTHTFTDPGTYVVSLTVKDTNDQTHTRNISISVEEAVNEAPVAVATATPMSGEAPLTVTFKGNQSTDDKGIVSYFWDFPQDPSSAPNNTRTFADPGTYDITLTVKDEEGLSDSQTLTITVNEGAASNEAPVAVATANPMSGDAPLTVTFRGSDSTDDNGIVSYFWDFPQDPSSAPNNTRTFNNPGVYDITLTVEDAQGLSDSKTLTITVNEPSGGGTTGGSTSGDYPPGAVMASSFGFNANDATEAFQNAIRSNSNFIVIDKQSSDWIVKPNRFFNLQNKTIVFEPGVVLRAKPGAFGGTADILFELYNARNVIIEGYGATFKMNKSEYDGEFRHTLKIMKSRNITVKGLILRDSGGDGIAITGPVGEWSENITIEDVKCINNKRLGLGIFNAKDVWVRNSEFRETSGTLPAGGVDLEPEHPSDQLTNINFIGCKFLNNDKEGVKIETWNLNGSSVPISVLFRNCTIGGNARKSFTNKPATEINISQSHNTNPVKGEVRFENVTIQPSNKRVLFSRKSDAAFKIIFNNCVAKNVIRDGQTPVIDLEARQTANSLGGFTFNNFYIEYTSNQPFMRISAPSDFPLKNITGTFTIKEPNDNPIEYRFGANPSNGTNVNIQYNHIN